MSVKRKGALGVLALRCPYGGLELCVKRKVAPYRGDVLYALHSATTVHGFAGDLP